METPDVKTLNDIIKSLMGEPCEDGNCRGCMIQRSFISSERFKGWLENVVREGESHYIPYHIAALCFQMGELFERQKRL